MLAVGWRAAPSGRAQPPFMLSPACRPVVKPLWRPSGPPRGLMRVSGGGLAGCVWRSSQGMRFSSGCAKSVFRCAARCLEVCVTSRSCLLSIKNLEIDLSHHAEILQGFQG